jgi:hypothetical protein
MERLPHTDLIAEALDLYRERFADLMRVIALPALANAVLTYFWYQIPERDWPFMVYQSLGESFLVTIAALSCHRVILQGPEFIPLFGASGTTARDWRFIGTAAVLLLVTNLLVWTFTLAIFIPAVLLEPEWMASLDRGASFEIGRFVSLPAFYIVCRYSICLPAAAIDRPLHLRQAWAITRGYGMRLLLLIGALPWLLHFIQDSLAHVFEVDVDYVIATELLYWPLLPLEIALLSMCYRRLTATVSKIH